METIARAAGGAASSNDSERDRGLAGELSSPAPRPRVGWHLEDEQIAAAARSHSPTESVQRSRLRLRHIVLWLHLNAMRFEKVQFRLLCEQTLANVWRKAAYRWLLEHHEMVGVRHPEAKPGTHIRRLSTKEEREREKLQVRASPPSPLISHTRGSIPLS